jgi:hypothetical protein
MRVGPEAVNGSLGIHDGRRGRAGQELKADLYTDRLKGCP